MEYYVDRSVVEARSCQTAGKDVPAGTMAMVSSSDFLRTPERPTAIATLNRQRHLTPTCGGLTPTAGSRECEKINEINGERRLCPNSCPDARRDRFRVPGTVENGRRGKVLRRAPTARNSPWVR